MKKKYILLVLVILCTVFACKDDDPIPVDTEQEIYLNLDINTLPLSTLSAYGFFKGELKNMIPVNKVVPYEPASSLFTDYALKKRFIWMPKGTKASYDTDGTTLIFPVGTVLIKHFYYNTLQPGNTTKIIETRLMIKKPSGWIFAEYIWNDSQTEATLLTGDDFMSGSSETITFRKPSGEIITTDYRIPSESECLACHKLDNQPIPIGTKPQNINVNYNYSNGVKNQLQKLVDEGYLASYPSSIVSLVDYRDTSKPIDIRLRSYIDINCAHCHQDNARCDYRPIRLSFNKSANPVNMGICVYADEPINADLERIIIPRNVHKSVMHYRLSTVDENTRMPLLGRTIVHDEGVSLLEQYINSLNQVCN